MITLNSYEIIKLGVVQYLQLSRRNSRLELIEKGPKASSLQLFDDQVHSLFGKVHPSRLIILCGVTLQVTPVWVFQL